MRLPDFSSMTFSNFSSTADHGESCGATLASVVTNSAPAAVAGAAASPTKTESDSAAVMDATFMHVLPCGRCGYRAARGRVHPLLRESRWRVASLDFASEPLDGAGASLWVDRCRSSVR